ncbi:cadherin-like domain-containing protein [Puniceibacterium sp. IMCC21224]|uniref:cadherin-like domain-containing protein n=1 Tax=Puniceibacterium sp. IMCC21224 TaxID=1618204 RepID=UPI00064DAEE1|nr:cadherin-like domain-containing protein [Puniceibacterium sp. IMCC21224]KMK68611.1 putative calcium-binding protein [Puniceibacterium sp. IMCC21224]
MTKLAPGGLAILGFNTTGEGADFSFVLLSGVTAGTEIYFTDTGTRDGTKSFDNTNSADGTLLWTAASDYAAGTVINFTADAAEFSQPFVLGIGGTNQPLDLRIGGDQLIAFQGDIVDSEIPDPNFIYAASTYRDTFQGTGDGREGDTSSVNQSGVPLGLTEGKTAIALGGSATSVDSVLYTGPTTGTKAELLAALAIAGNWSAVGTTQTQITADFTVTDAVANADPVLTLPGAVTLNEDRGDVIGGITVSDLEGDTVTLVLTAEATLHVTSGGPGTVTGNGSGSLTIVGSAADVNARVSSLFLDPPQNSSEDITLRVVASDKDGTSTTGTVAITVTPVDDAPQLELAGDAGGSADRSVTDTELATDPLDFAADYLITDPDGPAQSLNGFDLTVRYGTGGSDAGDLLQVVNTLADDGGAGFETGIDTEVNGTTGLTDVYITVSGPSRFLLGTIDGTENGQAGADLTITLGANADTDRVQILLDALRFSNPAATPGMRALEIQLSGTVDGGPGASDPDTITVTITDGNAAPVLADVVTSVTFDPTVVGTTPQVVDADVTLSDVDSADFDGGSLNITFSDFRPGASTLGEELSFDVSGPFSISGTDLSFSGGVIGTIASDGVDGIALSVDFTSANATPAVVEQLIEALRYRNTASAPETTREISITIADGDGATSVAQTVAIKVETITPPTIDRAVTYVEDLGDVLIDDLQQFTADGADGDQTVYAGGTLDITMTGDAASDGLTFPSSTTGVSDGDVLISTTGTLVLRESIAPGGYVRIGTVTGDGTRSLTITFETTDGTFFNSGDFVGFSRRPTADEVEKVVQTLQYTNSEGDIPTEGTRTVELVLTDAALTVEPTETFTVEVEAVEDDPVLSGVTATIGLDYSGGVPVTPATFNASFSVTDPDTTNFAGGEFRVSARTTTTEDNFSIIDGNGITVAGDQVSFASSVIGTVSGGTAGNDLVVALSGTVSDAAVNALGLQVAYLNSSATPRPERDITYSVTDGNGGESAVVLQTLQITGGPTLQPPVIGDIDTPVTPLASALIAGPVVLDAAVDLSDADMSGFDGGSLLLSYQAVRGAVTDQLSILSSGVPAGIQVSGANVSFNYGTVFGTIVQDGTNGADLEIAFSGGGAVGTAVEALIEALQYQSTATVPTGTTGLSLTVTDADGQVSDEVSFSVEIIDDGISFDDSASTREDNDLIVSFADLLSNDANFGDGVTITSVQAAVGGTVQIVGSNVVFSPTSDTSGAASFTYTAGDGVWTSTATVTTTVTPVNDAPVESGISGDVSTVIQSGAGAQALTGLADATVTDIDSADFDGGFVRIAQTGGVANGTFGLGVGVTSGGDSVLAAGETVSVGGTAIGLVSGTGAAGAALQVDLAATATPALLETFLQSLTYDIPTAVETRNFQLTLDDGDGSADGGISAVTATFAVQVSPNAPTINGLDGDAITLAFDAAAAVAVLGNAVITDADDADFDGGALVIARTTALSGDFSTSGTVLSGGDQTFAAGQTITVDGVAIGTVASDGQGSNDLEITLSAGATQARLGSFLQTLTYRSTDPGSHDFDTTLRDAPAGTAAGTSAIASFSVAVDAPPVLTLPVAVIPAPDSQATTITGISVADADSTTMTVTIGIPTGRGALDMTAQGTAGLSGSGGTTVSVTGTLADVNATLATLTVTPTAGNAADVTVTVTASDGSFAISGPNTDSGSVTVDVLNRPEILELSGDTLAYTEADGPRVLDQGTAASVIDLDSATLPGGRLTASFQGGGTADETLSFGAGVTLSGAQTDGAAVQVGGVTIGTLVAGQTGVAGQDLQILLSADATPALLSTVIGALTYETALEDVATTRSVAVSISDGDAGLSTTAVVTVNVTPVNDAPSLSVTPVLSSLAEDADTSARIKVADVAISDDALGRNDLSLGGADAALFELVGTEVFLAAGAALDFESQASLALQVILDDPALGTGPEASLPLSLSITDVNEAPSLSVTPVLSSLAEDADTSARIKIADVAISDDALGRNDLSLGGADAALFELVGTEVFLVAGAALDFESQASLALQVILDDPALGTGPEASLPLSLSITDVNEAPSLSVTPVLSSLAEDADTSARIKVADVAISDDALGRNDLSLGGADAALFELVGTEVFLVAGAALDFESQASLALQVILDDPALGTGPEASLPLSLSITDVNEAPSLSVTPVLSSLAEDADTSARIKVADVAISDDALGRNDLSLGGADAALFELVGTEVFLVAGAALDFESQASLALQVILDDPALGTGPEASLPLSLSITDVNEAPSLSVTPVLSSLAEDADTSARIKVADVAISDDALGRNDLSLGGADAALFELVGTEVFLVAGAALDFESQASLALQVILDDPALGTGPEASLPLSLSITDVNEAPSLSVTPVLSSLAEDADTSARIKIADVAISDDALGRNDLSLGGADAALFELVGTEVFLVAGAALDFESQASLALQVILDDPALGTGPEASLPLSLSITDVNEAPSLSVTPVLSSLAEDADTSARIKVADVAISDDALGRNDLSLGGADAALFELVGTEVFLVAGAALDFESQASLALQVILDDPALGTGPEASLPLSLSITDVNEAPSLSVTPVLSSLAEDADTSARIKVADVAISDDALGRNDLSLGGADAALFELVGTEVFLVAGAALDFESQASLALQVILDDPALGTGPEASLPLSLSITDVNEAPSLSVTPVLSSLAEDADTSARIKIADVAISDDALGRNDLSLGGADAALFELVGTEVFLAAGAALDFESQASLALQVILDDPALGTGPEASLPLSLSITDVNEAPSLSVTPVLSSLAEDADTSARIKVADVAISDDALGRNDLSLGGADAALFELVGTEVFLVAGAALDFESQASLALQVILDDPALGTGPEASLPLSLSITDVNEAPSLSVTPVLSSLAEDADTSARIKIADVAISDDALGRNDLSLGGADAALFELVGTEVFLVAGAALDFESQASLALQVILDDPALGTGPEASLPLSLSITDVNEAPSLSVTPVLSSLAEDADTSARIKVADVAISDDALGRNDLSLGGADAALFELVGTEVFLVAGAALDFESQASLALQVILDDPALGTGPEASLPLSLSITDVNEAPSLSVTPVLSSLAEDADTSARIKVADVAISDDALGRNDLSLGGADAALFELVGTEVFLVAGAALDFESQASLALQVILDDPALGTGPEASLPLSLSITDVNEAPSLSVTPVLSSLAEDADTSARIKVADVAISDDALGRNDLSLGGADAALFELVGTEVFLVAGAALDFESQASLALQVILDDPALGTGPEASLPLSLSITDVNEAPSLSVTPVLSSLAEDADTSARIKVADVAISDDALGRNDLSLGGADAALFELVGTEVFLVAGAALDFESQASLALQVILDDPALGTGPEASLPLSLSITDVNEAPSLSVTPVLSSLAEDADTSARIKVADVAISDDALGRNDLSLGGADAALFELVGTEVFLVAGAALDFESQASLALQVILDDPALGTGPEASLPLSLSITDVNENELIVGSPEAEFIDGREGEDTLAGLGGPDTLMGGTGDDRISGSTGDDDISGEDGNDTIGGGPGKDSISGGSGNDSLHAGMDDDTVSGGDGNDTIGGGPGQDSLDGGDGDDLLKGGDGDDTINGDAGDDYINGGTGDDALTGGSGNDTLGGGIGADTIDGGDGDDIIGGGAGQDLLRGDAGSDTIGGGLGNDTIEGGLDDDLLYGGGRNDLLDGGDGDDILVGGRGDDTLTGGEGADTFVFNFQRSNDADVVTDFDHGVDMLSVAGVMTAPGADAQDRFDALDITDVTGGALISYQGSTILIEGTAAADLEIDVFQFI